MHEPEPIAAVKKQLSALGLSTDQIRKHLQQLRACRKRSVYGKPHQLEPSEEIEQTGEPGTRVKLIKKSEPEQPEQTVHKVRRHRVQHHKRPPWE